MKCKNVQNMVDIFIIFKAEGHCNDLSDHICRQISQIFVKFISYYEFVTSTCIKNGVTSNLVTEHVIFSYDIKIKMNAVLVYRYLLFYHFFVFN